MRYFWSDALHSFAGDLLVLVVEDDASERWECTRARRLIHGAGGGPGGQPWNLAVADTQAVPERWLTDAKRVA